MSNFTNEQNLIQALDHYINHGTSMHDMHQVAHYLNLQSSISMSVHQKFYDMLSDMDFLKIKKAIELLEYLTAFCPTKIPEIVNDDKFMEYISQGLMENFLQDEVLNLIRFWADEYNDSKKTMNLVYLLIENLETFQIALPATYHSNYKTMAKSMTQNESQQNNNEPSEPIVYPPKLQTLLQQVTNIQNEIDGVLNGPAFEHHPIEAKRQKISLLLSKNFAVTSDISELNLQDPDFIQKAEEVKEELRKSRSKLHEKLTLLNKPVNSFPAPPQVSNDPYKIVISETENNAYPPNAGQESIENRIMEVDELLSYKTDFCPHGAACPHAPNPAVQAAEQVTTYNSEMHCKYWHSPVDRRRAVLDDNYKLLYNSTSCPTRPVCNQGDNCNFSHNFFERFYHPLNYKKNKCRFPNSCKNGGYCPYYHSTDEKEVWEDRAQPYFELLESSNDYNDNSENITDLLNSTHDNEPGVTIRTYPPTRNQTAGPVHHQPQGNPPPAGAHDHSGVRQNAGDHNTASNRSQNPSSFGKQHGGGHSEDNYHHHPPSNLTKAQAQEEQPKGTLNSKLIVRKKYENPDVLTSLFHSSQIFNGLPFFTPFPIVRQNEENDSSSPNKSDNQQ